MNALKHAYPQGGGGRISVAFATRGPDWTLSVSDDGVGMPTGTTPIKVGLGSSIVQALATQVGAKVHVADTNPGTKVSIVHKGSAGEMALTAAT